MKMWKIHTAKCGSFIIKGKTFGEAIRKWIAPYGMGEILSITEIAKQ